MFNHSMTYIPGFLKSTEASDLLMYGGISVAIILALAYFSKTLLQAIADLINRK